MLDVDVGNVEVVKFLREPSHICVGLGSFYKRPCTHLIGPTHIFTPGFVCSMVMVVCSARVQS
jgi:hypothetical protein